MLSRTPRQTIPNRPATRIPVVCVVDARAEDYQGWRESADASGVQLRMVASAEEGLRFSRTTPIDLWVVNTDLSGLSGCELCGMLKARDSRTAVYLVANEYTPTAEREALRHRATLFGCKGNHVEWLHQWLLQRDLASTTSPLNAGGGAS